MKVFRYAFLLICLTISPIFVFGQDLGSANDLFRTSNPKTKTAPAKKKPAPKPKKTATARSSKSSSAKKTNTNRRTATASNKPTKMPTSAKGTKTPEETELTDDVVIEIPDNSAEALKKEELFENAVDEGNNARDTRNYVGAEAAYNRAFNIKPNDFRAVYGLGNIYSDQQRWEEAERAYREAIRLSPNSSEPYVAVSFVLTQPITGKDLSARYAEAERTARKAIALDAKNPIAFDQLGVALELSGKIRQETKSAYQKAIELDPEFALAYAHLGRLLRRTGQINESAEAYRKAIQFSKDVPTMILVADVMQSQQRYTDSEQLLRRALREDPKNPTALYLLGRALTTRTAYDEAEKVLKKSLEVSPNSFVAYALLGSLYSRRGEFKDAEKILTEALKVVSENERKRLAQEFETVGDGLVSKGKTKDAVRVYGQAVALDTENAALISKMEKAKEK